MTDQELNAAAKKLYDACPTPKPKWEDLGDVTRSVWLTYALKLSSTKEMNNG